MESRVLSAVSKTIVRVSEKLKIESLHSCSPSVSSLAIKITKSKGFASNRQLASEMFVCYFFQQKLTSYQKFSCKLEQLENCFGTLNLFHDYEHQRKDVIKKMLMVRIGKPQLGILWSRDNLGFKRLCGNNPGTIWSTF